LLKHGVKRTSAQRVGMQRSALQHELPLITLWLCALSASAQHVAVQALGWGSRYPQCRSMRLLHSMPRRAPGVAHGPSSCLP